MDSTLDGHIRTGSLWSATAHAFTAVVGSGILALPWSVAQLGWIVGPFVLVAFAFITYLTAILLSDCYRTPDLINGKRNRTYIDAVRSFLGPKNVLLCGIIQYTNLWGAMIGYTVTTAVSIATVKKLTCFHVEGRGARCEVSGNLYMMIFGAIEIVLSQCPNLEEITFLSVIASITSFMYGSIALYLSAAKFITNHKLKGSILIGHVGEAIPSSTTLWHVFQSLGNIAFAYTYAIVLLEIQDTLRSPPAENKTMKKATLYAVSATAIFYISLGCIGYAAFGSDVPGNILTGFDKPFWLIDIGNLAVVIHLIGAYQVFAQPLFAKHEKMVTEKWPTSVLNTNHSVRLIPFKKNSTFNFTINRLLLRTLFVIFTTIVAMMFPFFNAILGLLGALSFWPLTVYFPLRMYTAQMKIRRGTPTWIFFQVLSSVCLIVTLLSATGSVADMIGRLKTAKLFHIEL